MGFNVRGAESDIWWGEDRYKDTCRKWQVGAFTSGYEECPKGLSHACCLCGLFTDPPHQAQHCDLRRAWRVEQLDLQKQAQLDPAASQDALLTEAQRQQSQTTAPLAGPPPEAAQAASMPADSSA